MPLHRQLQHLIENLIALKDLYHTQLVESEKKVAHFKEQLSHVNGLLVAQLVENQQFVQSLVDMRSQCHAQLETNQRQAARAREQLTHVNALLADQITLPPTKHPLELQATAIEAQQQQALSGGAETEAELFSQPLAVAQQQLQTQDATPLEVKQTSEEPVSSTLEPEQKSEEPASSTLEPEQKSEEPISSTLEPEQANEEPISSTLEPEQANEEPVKSASALKTPMKPEYQNLTKIQAVEKLLRENQGKILTVEYIIWSLYDGMDTEAVKAEKPRIYDTLGQGTDKGLWEKVPDQPACYTYRLSLVEPAADSESTTDKTNSRLAVSSRRRPSRRGRSDDMLPRYNHLSLTAAVEVVVNEHPAEVITTEKVAKELYGEDIEGRALIKAKDRIGKTLWGGANQGRWQRIPGRLGCYTLNLKTLKKG